MRRSNLKISIEYRTRGFNTKEEHFSNGSTADALYESIKLTLDNSTSERDIKKMLAAVEDSQETGSDSIILTCTVCDLEFNDWSTVCRHLHAHPEFIESHHVNIPAGAFFTNSLFIVAAAKLYSGDVATLYEKYYEVNGGHEFDEL